MPTRNRVHFTIDPGALAIKELRMRAWMVIAVAAVLGVAAAGSYYGLEIYPQQLFRENLDRTLATLPPGTTATYKTAHYSVLSHRAVVTGWTVHGAIPADPPVPFDITADSVETENPNADFAAAWGRAITNPAAFGPDTALPVADSIAIKGLTIHSAAINATYETAGATKLRLYPWALLHEGMPSWADVQASLAPRSSPPEQNELRAILRVEAAAVMGVGLDSHALGATKITETFPGADIEFDIHKLTAGTFDRGVMQGGVVDGMTFSGKTLGTVSFDRIAVGAVDMRQPMTQLINGEALSLALLDGVKIGRVEYIGLTAQPPDKPAFHVGRFWLGPVAFTQGMPVTGELGWSDFSISKAQLPEERSRDAFDLLGLETMTISFAVAYDWDVSGQHATVRDTVLKINELGTISLAVELTGVAAGPTALMRARLAHARLRFDDASLVDRLLRAGARQSGTDPAAYRQVIEAMVRQQASTIGGSTQAISAAGQAVSDFIAAPSSLTIELAPPTPVPLIALKGLSAAPSEAAATLGVTVSANQK
jgi:hypothetical protein